MNFWVEVLAIIGVGYTSYVITRIIVWLDSPKHIFRNKS